MCAGLDSNQRRHLPTDLQSVVIDHSTTDATEYFMAQIVSEQCTSYHTLTIFQSLDRVMIFSYVENLHFFNFANFSCFELWCRIGALWW